MNPTTSYEIQQKQRAEALKALEVAKELEGRKHFYRIKNWGSFDKNNKAHMQVMSHLRSLNWTKPHEKYGRVADTWRFSEWLKSKKSPVNKPLVKMNKNEVSKIICALEGMILGAY